MEKDKEDLFFARLVQLGRGTGLKIQPVPVRLRERVYGLVAQRQRHSIQDRNSVGSNPTKAIFFICRRGPIGRGDRFRPYAVEVRILSAAFYYKCGGCITAAYNKTLNLT